MVNPFEQTAVAGKKRGYAKPRWTDRFSATVDKGRDIGSNMIPGIWGAGMKGLEALTEGVAMANENARWFRGNAPDTKRHAGVPMNVRESVMTDRDTTFYNKYMNLASLTDDADKRKDYLKQADTARRNLQITKRINYGMGQMDLDPTPFGGYESYDQGFEGFGPDDLGPRFDIDKFSEAMSEYLPGGKEVTEDITETISSPHEIETETIAETPPEVVDRSDPLPLENWFYTPPFDEEVSIMDLPIEEDITETIKEDDFVLKKAEFSQGNLGTEGKYDYSPTWDLNIRDIQDYELKKKAVDAATRFNNMWKSGESDMYEMERLYDEYLAAVEAGAKPSLENITSQIEDINLQLDDSLEDEADLLNRIESLKNENRANNMLFDI